MDDRGPAADEAEVKDSDVDPPAIVGERDFRAVLQSAHEAFVAMDAGGFIIDWNPEAEATFGWSKEEAVGRILADTIIPERHREAHWNGLQRYLETGEERVLGKRIEIDALHRSGHEFPVELTISARRSGTGHFFNAFLHDISDRRRAALYVDAQHAVTRILAEADSEAEVIAGLLRELGERSDWEYGAFWRMDEDTGRLVCTDAWIVGGEHLERFAAASQDVAFEPGVGLPGRVWDSRRPAFIVDVLEDDNFPRAPAAAEAGLHGAICFPLVSDEDRLGVIEFLTSAIGQSDEKLLDSLASIGTQVGQHLTVLRERAELLARMDAMARTDELTDLPNRRAWDEELHRALARAQRSGEGVSVAVLDLDRFKDFNDTHGHPAGDQLLKQAGAAWPRALRTTDFVARYGGEEFAVLLPACPPDSAVAVVERIRAVTPMGQTCSAGIATWDREESAEELVGRADAALYEAKRAGRDRIVLAEGVEPAE
jgi:diguanylate cyclase (GGDEF)-like protein/PAS domain S-box-containing protein